MNATTAAEADAIVVGIDSAEGVFPPAVADALQDRTTPRHGGVVEARRPERAN